MPAGKSEAEGKVQGAGRPETARNVQEAWREFRSSLRALLPAEFWEHQRAARREMLLAARSLIDAAIERVEQADGAQQKRAQKIKIE